MVNGGSTIPLVLQFFWKGCSSPSHSHEQMCVHSGFLGFHMGFMEACECGKEACSAGRTASGALDSDVRHRAILPLMCGLFGYLACM